jgi:4-hydroxy-2-oxoheptanedioate aldolase
MARKFRKKLHNETVLGLFSKTSDAAFIEAMGYGGFDFVIIDLEHGPNNLQTAQNLIRASEVSGIFPIVRVKEDNYSIIGDVLDIGALGIQVPQVNNAEVAYEVMKRAKFFPMGMRGVCGFVRAANYSSMNKFQYFKDSNETVVILQLEGKEGLEAIDSIIDVKGIDVVFIGPYDLSQSLGLPGQVDHPTVLEKMKQVNKKCLKKGIAVGTFVDTIENAKRWKALGVSYIAYSVDVGIFLDKCAEVMKSLK